MQKIHGITGERTVLKVENVALAIQLEPLHPDRSEVSLLECNPVSKNGEDIKHLENHLMCYQVALINTKPAQPKFPNPKPRVFLNNQFGQEALTASAIESLCVPSLKDPPS